MMIRAIKKIFRGQRVLEGAGVKLRRIFGFSDPELFDPFLLFDDFSSENRDDFIKGFPWHPHRGIETITYVLKGDVEHGDSLGNKGVISSGDVQWMTAGSGIIHQEMPIGDPAGRLKGFQLWANLPASQKMMIPRYRSITPDDIPVVQREDGTIIRVVAGNVDDVRGPVDDVIIDPEYMDITVNSTVEFTHTTPKGYTVFLYCIEGTALIDDVTVEAGQLVLFNDGDTVSLVAGGNGVRFLFCSGKPLNEPIAWRGPIVMNTDEELELAFEELHQDTFIKQTI
jgi:redox-sensitive bicupin YhaK (pirin superfamily)